MSRFEELYPGHLHSFFVSVMGHLLMFFFVLTKCLCPGVVRSRGGGGGWGEPWAQLELTGELHMRPSDFLLSYLLFCS